MAAMPRESASRGPAKRASTPSTRTAPELGGCAPATTFISEDLPAPLSPHTPTTWPGRSASDTPSMARSAP